MPIEAYRFPNFLALLPEKPGGEINPHFKEVNDAFNAWVEQKFDGPSAVNVHECEAPLISSFVLPLASYEQLKGIVDYTAVGFLIDDILDRSSGEVAAALSQLWMNTLRDVDEAKSIQHPVIEMLRSEVMPGIKASVGSFHWPQFISENKKLLMQMAQESHDRKSYPSTNSVPDIQSYIIQRRLSIGTGVYYVLVRLTRCLYIPDDVLANSVVREMEDAATDMLIISNDVYSFKKEYSFDGAFANVLTAMEKDSETAHLDFQGRLDYTGKLFKVALERFYACKQELPSFSPEMDRYLALYVDGLLDMVIGNLQWSCVARRYKTSTHDEDSRDNVVRLASDACSANENDATVY